MKTNIVMAKSEILRRLLIPLWLRPESALWYAHMLFMARKFLCGEIISPSLEFGCMDGVNTVVLLGGEFGEGFDVYQEAAWNRDSHKQSTLKDDYFNIVDDDVEVKIENVPQYKFDYGVDWKDAHIKKSERAKVFKKLLKIDIEKPQIPIEDESVKTIWAPNIYWSPNLGGTLKELHRILHLDGRIVTIAPDKKQIEFMLYRFAKEGNAAWLKDLDRGRYENSFRHARTKNEWERVFGDVGLAVTRHEFFIPSVVAKVYDIGLRPMFPVFMNMYEKLRMFNNDDLLDLKKHWIDTVYHFLSPLCDDQWMKNMPKAWHIFELRRA